MVPPVGRVGTVRCRGTRQQPQEGTAPGWPEDSLGDRFFGGTDLDEARTAPCLLTAQIPDAAVIAVDPGHWNVAIKALIRAVAFGSGSASVLQPAA